MSNKVIVMHAGRKVAFATRQRQREHVLYAKGVRDRIAFTTKGRPLGRIAGKGMAGKVSEPVPDGNRETYVLELLDEGDTVQLTTPAEDQKTCIYLEAVRGSIHLVGGSILIERIEGRRLARVLEPESVEK